MQMMVQSYRALQETIDVKSKWTAGHSRRVASYADKIGMAMRLTNGDAKSLTVSAILHDIGKTAVPQRLLNKSRGLTRDEIAMVRRHPEKGVRMVAGLPFYEQIKGGILHHHERWDGSGYPSGLKKRDIPLFARIIAVADVFDSLTSDRPYRKGCSREDALLFLQEKKGTHFAPDIVDIFTTIFHNEKKNTAFGRPLNPVFPHSNPTGSNLRPPNGTHLPSSPLETTPPVMGNAAARALRHPPGGHPLGYVLVPLAGNRIGRPLRARRLLPPGVQVDLSHFRP